MQMTWFVLIGTGFCLGGYLLPLPGFLAWVLGWYLTPRTCKHLHSSQSTQRRTLFWPNRLSQHVQKDKLDIPALYIGAQNSYEM